ncbi:11-beta-hydroxysteroid dehydrogenase 1-like [Alligator mississippiensis]|uniref:11-beta-hydroxysteroid dehydrogenase 1-like n=1 Tax=Alligator mississippiensis TaxID=8496 RepID=UPI00287784F5|nr:11-beta-hydroxysteroid dehydrogenase 1-like [Alligator mississippiensis]
MENMAFAQEVVKEAEKLWGGLDMLILNHIGSAYFGYFKGDTEHLRKLLEINVLSYVTMTVSALPMLKESRGSIVAVSSLAENFYLDHGPRQMVNFPDAPTSPADLKLPCHKSLPN